MPWISSFEDVIEDKGDYVAHQVFLRNPDIPPTKFTIGRLIDYVMKTLFARNPEWNEVPRKVRSIPPCLWRVNTPYLHEQAPCQSIE